MLKQLNRQSERSIQITCLLGYFKILRLLSDLSTQDRLKVIGKFSIIKSLEVKTRCGYLAQTDTPITQFYRCISSVATTV